MGALGKLIAKLSRNTQTRLSPCATLTPSRNGDPVVSFHGHSVTSTRSYFTPNQKFLKKPRCFIQLWSEMTLYSWNENTEE